MFLNLRPGERLVLEPQAWSSYVQRCEEMLLLQLQQYSFQFVWSNYF